MLGFADHNVPHFSIFMTFEGLPELVPQLSIFLTNSNPSVTSPKTTCLPSNQLVTMVVMKNWEPLVLGPALAIESCPGLVCFNLKFSSANFSPQMLLPPVPLWLVKSPPWSMNCGMTLWNDESLQPKPFSPVQSALKLAAVLGTSLSQSMKTIRPAGYLSMVISKKQLAI